MDACRGEFVGEVFLPCREEQFVERPVVQLRLVVQFDLLAVAREGAVIVRDDGLQPLRELPPQGVYSVALLDELQVVNAEHRFVGHVLEQAVAFGQHAVVTHYGGQVGAVELRDEAVEVAAAFVRGVADERTVGRRHDHGWNQPHVIRQPFVLLSVAFEHLAALARERAHDALRLARIGEVLSFGEEEIRAVADALPVGHRQRRLAHREVIDRVDDIGLARPVVAHQAVDAGAQGEFLLCDILEVEQRYFLQIHGSKIVQAERNAKFIWALPRRRLCSVKIVQAERNAKFIWALRPSHVSRVAKNRDAALYIVNSFVSLLPNVRNYKLNKIDFYGKTACRRAGNPWRSNEQN